MNQKGFIQIPILIAIIVGAVVVGGAGYFIMNRQTLSPEPTSSPTPSPLPSPSLSNDCKELISYSAKAYQDGWEKKFKKENNLSDSQFSAYVTITAVSLRPVGNTCELAIRYIIKKDWLVVNQVDDMTLGVSPTISPDNLPLESDPTKPGRIGVSTVTLHDPLSFKNQTEALNFFVDKYNLKGTDAKIWNQGFQYFWNKESAEKSGYPFAGEGGEAFISVSGTINSSQNKCYKGELSLVSKKTIYRDTPCRIN
jgi:hypothetical protein